MPLIESGHDELAHIDITLTEADLIAARTTLAEELDASASKDALHPSIPATDYTPNFPSLTSTAHDQIASTGKPRPEGEGISLARYEEPDAPESTDTLEQYTQWDKTLSAAYTSQSYLSQRALNLSLLERYGKNSWLISNAQVEDDLHTLERELKTAKDQGFVVDEERRHRQQGVRGEMEALQQSWQESLGRAIEAEVAGAQLHQEILAARRAGAAP
ncbi:hypothetical protein FH972_025703 [Carpinus fangiana]|uniref:Breast carcinoma amplified sequence 2 n=1 Tax=Carpinus fangiana TaxID=176857 RepID=A0A5N6L2D9_9ROSI|nr:hypothetical protein FH972_025703 [Carpinus fangiana]